MQRQPDMPKRIRFCSHNPTVSGTTLLRCSRCKSTWYENKTSQKEHWKIHKRSCKQWTSEDQQSLDKITSVSQLWQLISPDLQKGSYATARRLIRLRVIFDQQLDENDDDDDFGMGGGRSDAENARMDGDVRRLTSTSWNPEKLWGAPGMTQLLMSEDLLDINKREWSTSTFSSGLPLDSFLKITSENKDSTTKKQWQRWIDKREETRHDSDSSGSYRYAWIHSNLLVASAMQNKNSKSWNNEKIANAAYEVALNLWNNDRVFESTNGNTSMPTVSYLALITYDQFASNHGTTVSCAISAIRDISSRSFSCSHSIKLLTLINQKQQTIDQMAPGGTGEIFWSSFDTVQRAGIAFKLVVALSDKSADDLVEKEKSSRQYDDCDSMPVFLFTQMLEKVCGADASTRIKIWTQGANGHYGTLGEEDEYRAFFYFLNKECIRHSRATIDAHFPALLIDVPDSVANHICKYLTRPQDINIATLVWKWRDTLYPRYWVEGETSEEMMEASRNKMLCLKAVMNRTYFNNYFKGMYGEETDEEKAARINKVRSLRINNIYTPNHCWKLPRSFGSDDKDETGLDFDGKPKVWFWIDRCRNSSLTNDPLYKYKKTIQDMSSEELIGCIRRQTRWLMKGGGGEAQEIPQGTYDGNVLDGKSHEQLKKTLLKILGDTKWEVEDEPQCRKLQAQKEKEEKEQAEKDEIKRIENEDFEKEKTPKNRAEFDALRQNLGEMVAINHRRTDSQWDVIHDDAVNGYWSSLIKELNAGTHVDFRTSMTETPLMLAALYQRVKCVKILLARGADVWLVDYRGENAMKKGGVGGSYYKEDNENSIEIVRLLEEAMSVQPEPE